MSHNAGPLWFDFGNLLYTVLVKCPLKAHVLVVAWSPCDTRRWRDLKEAKPLEQLGSLGHVLERNYGNQQLTTYSLL